ncbi:MAG TPA: hypothetical protein VMW17_09020 [Candidatus Binatia bacterium]|nr:hypothetical protein [Candidatus Binatia bacterium]
MRSTLCRLSSTWRFVLGVVGLLAIGRGATYAAEEPAPNGIAHIQLDHVAGQQAGLVRIEATLTTNGASVVEMSNTVAISSAFRLAGNCSANTNIGKSSLISLVGQDEGSTTIRVQLVPNENAKPIPDGFLYRCGVQMFPTTREGEYPVRIGDPRALDPSAAVLAVISGDGLIVVEPGDIRRGDTNSDEVIDGDDLTFLESLVYRGYAGGAADVNGDTLVNAAHLVAAVDLL